MGKKIKKFSKAFEGLYHYPYCDNIAIIFTRNRKIYLPKMYVIFKRAQSYYEKSKMRV